MIKNLVSGWLPGRRYRKPSDLAEQIRPEADSHSSINGIPEELRETIQRSQDALLRQQNPEDGYWCGAIFGDTTIDADTVMLLNFLGRGHSIKVRRIANHLLNMQNPDAARPI